MSRISYRAKENGTDHFEIYFEDLIPEIRLKLIQFIEDNGGDISQFKQGLPLHQFHSDTLHITTYKDLVNIVDSNVDQGDPWPVGDKEV